MELSNTSGAKALAKTVAVDAIDEGYDVIVVGSGAGGMLAAIRAHDFGLKSVVIEKSAYYGGTSAVSGGEFWVPGNHLQESEDSEELIRAYLSAASKGDIRDDLLVRYLSAGPAMVRYLCEIGLVLKPNTVPDYFSEVVGAVGGRSLIVEPFDGYAVLGDELFAMRELSPVLRLFGRYALTATEGGVLALRLPKWRRLLARIFFNYWRNLAWRSRTKRDRRLTLGNALMGGLRKAMLDRHIPLLRHTELTALDYDGQKVTGAHVRRHGRALVLRARRAVVLATGGFEHSQALRDAHHLGAAMTAWSMAPGTNSGEGMIAGEAIGAVTELLGEANWWPTTLLPNGDTNELQTHFVFRYPHSIVVNGRGERYLNESMSYDRIGRAMLAEQRRSRISIPSWIIFDASCRRDYLVGGLLPGRIRPDRTLPIEYWDSFVFKEDSIGALARKIGIDERSLRQTVARFNELARAGEDLDFRRGEAAYDRMLGGGNPSVRPNPCLAPLECGPFYAMKVFPGDIGTKGGLRTDANGQVLAEEDQPLEGLYAVGNVAASIFRNCYPGPGATLGPALTFAFAAADHIASRAAIGSDGARTLAHSGVNNSGHSPPA